MKHRMKLAIGFFVVVLTVLVTVALFAEAQGGCEGVQTIEGDTVAKECAGLWKLAVTPHTAAFWDPVQPKSQEMTLDSHGVEGPVQCGMAVDAPPEELRISEWAEVTAYRSEPVYGFVTENFTCDDPAYEFTYTESPKWVRCATGNDSVLFEGEVTLLDIGSRYFEWEYETAVASQDVPYTTEGWADRTPGIVHYDRNGKHLYAVDVSLVPGQDARLKLEYVPEFNGEPVLKWEAYCWQGDLGSPSQDISVDPWATDTRYSWWGPVDGLTDIDTGLTTARFTGMGFELGGSVSLSDDFSSKAGWWEYNEAGGYSQVYVDTPNRRLYAYTQRNRHDSLWALRNVSLGTDDYEVGYQFKIDGSSIQVGQSFGLYTPEIVHQPVVTGIMTYHPQRHTLEIAYTSAGWKPRWPVCRWSNRTHTNSAAYGYSLSAGAMYSAKLIKSGLNYRCELYSGRFQTLLWSSSYTAPNKLNIAHVGADNGHDDYGGNWMREFFYNLSVEGAGSATSGTVTSKAVAGNVSITDANCSYVGTTPAGTALDVRFRAGNSPWYSCDRAIHEVACTSNCNAVQWKADLSTTTPGATPTLSAVNIEVIAPPIGDLEIIDYAAIQVLASVSLIKDKEGVIWTQLRWSSETTPSIGATLTYNLIPIGGGTPLPLGAQRVQLSNEEDGLFTFNFTPRNKGKFFVNVSALPDINDLDLENNGASSILKEVIDTDSLHITYVPIKYKSSEFSVFRDAAFKHHDALQRVYPLSKDDAKSGLLGVPYQPTENELKEKNKNLYTLLYNIMEWTVRFGPKYPDRISGIFPKGLFTFKGYTQYSQIKTVLAREDTFLTTAHEVGHTFRLCDENNRANWSRQNKELKLIPPYTGCPNGDYDSDGKLDQDCIYVDGSGCKVSALDTVVPWDGLDDKLFWTYNNLMGYGDYNSKWMDELSYNHLIDELSSPVHLNVSERMLISGLITQDGPTLSVEFEPFEQLESGEIIEDEYSQGNTVLEFLNNEGTLLLAQNFTPVFTLLFEGGGTIETNVTGFAFVVERPSDVARIRIRNETAILGERYASQHAPQVTIKSPSERTAYKETVTLSWEATDSDGDSLVYAVGVSSDGGKNWNSLVAGYPNTSVVFNITQTLLDPTASFLIRVRAMDGFYSTDAIMNVSFEMNPGCTDLDGDDVCDISDNCPNDKNPLQEDFEHDGLGDVCDPDDDNDSVLDVNDRCQFSVLPEIVPTDHLLPNHYADIDGDGYFESVNPRSNLISEDAISFSLTFGCSCEEILATKPGDTLGEFKFGCTKGTLDMWAAGRGWAR